MMIIERHPSLTAGQAHRRSRLRTLVALVSTVALSITVPLVTATPAHASDWSAANCYNSAQLNPSGSMSPYSRATARYYADYYRYEGYHWDGGCYALNDLDACNTEVHEAVWSTTGCGATMGSPGRGEGNDCSGFVDRIWGLNGSNNGFTSAALNPSHFTNHSYTGTWYYTASGYAWNNVAKTYAATDIMDIFVRDGHVGLIYDEGSSNSDWIVEALGESDGTGLNYEPYRGSSSFVGRARTNWG